MNTDKLVEVVAGVLYNPQGEFLLSSRPAGKAYAGYWEFAGGKVETGETYLTALQREFKEELGIDVIQATPWLTKIHKYEHAHVHLHFYRIGARQWQGQLCAREQQSWCWQQPGKLTVTPMLPANAPILAALSIPTRMRGQFNTGFHTVSAQEPQLKILPYHSGIAAAASIYAPANQLQYLAQQHPIDHIWAICSSREQWQQAQSAAAIIWPISSIDDIKLLLTLLQQEPSSVPVMVFQKKTGLTTPQPDWMNLGAHGIIHEQE
ncbi:MAG: NUDIX domain-containing protein [Snodgrassella alvi]